MNKPELLAPAGNMDSLRAALHFGADAVYGGMHRFGQRAFAGTVSPEALREAVARCHDAGARFYLTLNVFPYDDELADLAETARFARETGVDAAIVSDLGAICTLRGQVPDLPLHVSTQASTVNHVAAAHYRELGCERVILAREMSLERIAALRRQVPADLELETFVHGASCVAWSGRCLLSAELTGRSGNRGACAQPCRWNWSLSEEKRPGEYLPIEEDDRGTYLLSARDLNAMPILPELVAAGVSSLKIEGRMKTEYYVATVTAAYRRALDLLCGEGEEAFRAALPALMDELRACSHRAWDTGFLQGGRPAGGAEGFSQTREYVARAVSCAAPGEPARYLLKNRFHRGDPLELLTPAGPVSFRAPAFLRESTGETLDTLGIAGEIIRMALPAAVSEGDLLRGPVRNHREG